MRDMSSETYGGRFVPLAGRSLLTTEPKVGRVPGLRLNGPPDTGPKGKPLSSSSGMCVSVARARMLRTTASLSAILAWSGISSQMSKPGTLVLIGLNSPRYSAGAPGLRSYMSWCGGAPHR